MSPLHVQPVGAGDGSPAHYVGPMGLGRDGNIEAMPQFWGNATVPRQCHKSTQVDTRMRQSCPDMDVCFLKLKSRFLFDETKIVDCSNQFKNIFTGNQRWQWRIHLLYPLVN